ncbi:MAG TPA: cyclic nucleotide-binding domain-containing protein [Anaerolineales bacterium]|nr:cyclic nucleotide-binding domain-containing protein [Anaerolineales bacterium]HNE03755.1 cyclic nucleotide-binding domain-containing protein [Anaerolineales bacterium]HNF93607.1 cyclic nucleotide-binding domain-containing protein [Anaerolineales bacterium]HNM38058.1 cyclic nucleotide-binding domain-containing protein [Anaerolineales bacterium]
MLDNLPGIPLFENLNPEQRFTLMSVFEKFACSPGTVIFEQGDIAKYLYLILRGKAVISYKPYDGPRIVLSRLKDGDVFGWSAVVGGKKYSSSVASETTLETIRIRRELLQNLLTQTPETGKIIIDRLALNVSPRWKNAHEQIKPLIHEERKQ